MTTATAMRHLTRTIKERPSNHATPYASAQQLRETSRMRWTIHTTGSPIPPTQLTQAGIVDTIKLIYGKVMTQMTAKKGIKEFGQEAVAALMQAFAQMENLDVYEAVDARLLTRQQRRAALRAINLIKRKRDGTLKGRTVADGSVQRALYDKVETASPTVATDALLLSILIDAHEGRDVATADVADAYLKAYMTDLVIMKFTGETVDILCKMNPKHRKFVVVENGVRVLYVKLIKALYGCVKSALLWHELFSTTLEGMGFKINPYEPCIANYMIDDKQCTVAWYVDDTKIFHVDQGVVSRVIQQIEGHFGKMAVARGKEHTFLGMNIEYTDDQKAIISMRNHLEEAIAECDMEIKREAATPARRTLFKVDPKANLLNKHQAETFHRIVAKLLYVSIRARADILLPVAFLCTRVSKSTEQDRGKLRRVLEYVSGTLDLTHTLGADDLCKLLRTWVDASYAVHTDMRSHTGGIMSFGLGGLVTKSTKNKPNSKSSTEAELIGASNYLPNVIWVKLFMEAQGYHIHENFFEQDNESAIKLEKNGRRSAGPKSRHVDIRYFWIKDRVKEHGITIRHCPTLRMLADFFTKPLQGALFRKFRDVILGYKNVNSLDLAPRPELEERVGDMRSSGSGTDGPVPGSAVNDDRTSVRLNVSWADVVKGTRGQQQSNNNESVSRDHSLETIQLAKRV